MTKLGQGVRRLVALPYEYRVEDLIVNNLIAATFFTPSLLTSRRRKTSTSLQDIRVSSGIQMARSLFNGIPVFRTVFNGIQANQIFFITVYSYFGLFKIGILGNPSFSKFFLEIRFLFNGIQFLLLSFFYKERSSSMNLFVLKLLTKSHFF